MVGTGRRPPVHDLGAETGIPGVNALPERRVGAQGKYRRQPHPDPVEYADRLLTGIDRHVDVAPAGQLLTRRQPEPFGHPLEACIAHQAWFHRHGTSRQPPRVLPLRVPRRSRCPAMHAHRHRDLPCAGAEACLSRSAVAAARGRAIHPSCQVDQWCATRLARGSGPRPSGAVPSSRRRVAAPPRSPRSSSGGSTLRTGHTCVRGVG